MQDVEQLAKRVIIIDHGTIIYDGNLSDLIKKYATHKSISVILTEKVDRKALERVGEVIEYTHPKVTIKVLNKNVKKSMTLLIEHFPVDDVTIENMQIEDIIRGVFT